MVEKWRDVPGWEGLYEISSEGRIRSQDRYVAAAHGSLALRRGRVLTPVRKNGRYLAVTLAKAETRVQVFLHDLVLRAFHGPKPDGHQVCHRNCDNQDNRLENLRYDTPQGNAQDTIAAGRRPRGRKHPMAKLTDEDVREIRRGWGSLDDVAAQFGISAAHVWAIRAFRVWRHLA